MGHTGIIKSNGIARCLEIPAAGRERLETLLVNRNQRNVLRTSRVLEKFEFSGGGERWGTPQNRCPVPFSRQQVNSKMFAWQPMDGHFGIYSENLLTSVVTSRIVTNKKAFFVETRNVFKLLICINNFVVANQGLEPRTCGV